MFKKLRAWLKSTEVNPSKLEIEKLKTEVSNLRASMTKIQDVYGDTKVGNLIKLARIDRIAREVNDCD